MSKFSWPSFNKPKSIPVTESLPPQPVSEEKTKQPWLDELLGVNFEPGTPVRVQRSNGEMEDGWRVGLGGVAPLIEVIKQDGDRVLRKNVLYKDLAEWNAPSKEEIEK